MMELIRNDNLLTGNKKHPIYITYILTFFIISTYPFYFIIIGMVLFVIKKDDYSQYIFVISTVMYFTLINYNKEIFTSGNDLVWYTLYWYEYAKDFLTIENVLYGDIYTVTPKLTEPVFHYVCYILSNIVNGNYFTFVFMNMLSTYFTSYLVIKNILKIEGVDNSIVLILVCMQMYVFYDFGNAYNILRQYMAMAFVIISLYHSYKGNIINCGIFSILSILTHNSSILLVLPFFMLCFVDNKKQKITLNPSFIYFFSVAITVVFSLAFLLYSGWYEDLEDQGRGNALKLIDVGAFILSTFAMNKNKFRYKKIWRYYFVTMLILIFSHISSFLPLRYFTYLDSIKWIGWFIIFETVKNEFNLKVYRVFYLLSFVYLYLKISNSTFVYNIDFIRSILVSPYELIITNNMYL
jgi:hypothetical protein